MTAYHDEHENLLASSLPPKMAADIVERLRERADGEEDNYFHGGGTNGLYPLLREAATEIETLRAELLESQLSHAAARRNFHTMQLAADTLRKRVGEVEGALRLCQPALAMMVAPGVIKDTTVLHAFAHGIAAEAAARRALNQEEPKHADL